VGLSSSAAHVLPLLFQMPIQAAIGCKIAIRETGRVRGLRADW
jgi:hypothetical protein